jgi:hypothetical protein
MEIPIFIFSIFLLQNMLIIDNPVKAFQRIVFTINLLWALSDHGTIASLSGQIFSTAIFRMNKEYALHHLGNPFLTHFPRFSMDVNPTS